MKLALIRKSFEEFETGIGENLDEIFTRLEQKIASNLEFIGTVRVGAAKNEATMEDFQTTRICVALGAT